MAVLFAQPIEEYPQHLAFSTTPTMTNVDSSYPASKLVTYDPTAVARTTSGSTVITWNFGLQREFDVVSLIYTNTSYAATIVIDASNNGTSWTNLQASRPFWAHRTSVPGSWSGEANDPRRGALLRNHSWYYSSTIQTWQYIRITVSDPNVTNITFGRLFVGRSFSPTTGMQYGTSFSFADSGKRDRTDRGAVIMDATSNTIVSVAVKTEFLTATEMYDYVYEFNYWRGSCREMLVCLDTTDTTKLHKNILYCVLSEGRSISSDAFNAYSQTWNLESLA
jgi:hypothetical protein